MQVMKVTAIALPWLICCVPIRIFIKFLLLLTTGHLCVSCAILIHQSACDPKRGTMKRRCFNAGHFLNEAGCVQATQNLTNASFHHIFIASDEANPMRFAWHSQECLGRKTGRHEANVLSACETQDVFSTRLAWIKAPGTSPTAHSIKHLTRSSLRPFRWFEILRPGY